MKIAFVGKGGSGKTTLTSLFAQYLITKKIKTFAIDADINQHLVSTLDTPNEDMALPPMGLEIDRIKQYLIGSNKRITSIGSIVKTTPPAVGSNFVRDEKDNSLLKYFSRDVNGIQTMAVGPPDEGDVGIRCYHSKTGVVELLLNHWLDSDEYILVDMTAGADAFASGLFTRFDITFIAVEPTKKSVDVFKQYTEYGEGHDIIIKAVGNKITDESDLDFLQQQLGDQLISTLSLSKYVRSLEKGNHQSIKTLEPANIQALDSLLEATKNTTRDWNRYLQQAILFHKKNADSWANTATGENLHRQIDPNFSYTDYLT